MTDGCGFGAANRLPLNDIVKLSGCINGYDVSKSEPKGRAA